MKKNWTFLLAVLALMLYTAEGAFAQPSEGGTPPSFAKYVLAAQPDMNVVPAPDMTRILAEDNEDAKNGGFYKAGRSIAVDFDIHRDGTWFKNADGSKIWKLRIKSPGAKALAVVYDEFYLPKGCKLFLYSYDKSQVIGAYTYENSTWDVDFSTELIHGDDIVLEYYEPARRLKSADVQLKISEIAFAYRGVDGLFAKYTRTTGWGQSDNCEVNVNCSEGTNWQNQKRGVAEIWLRESGSWGWCTGSLVNNTNQDCTPYFLTADHCGGTDATTADLNVWQFYFNYESSTCSTPGSEPSHVTMTGCTRKAVGGISGGSDFFLLQFNSAVPTNYNPYYNGWSNSTSASTSGVSIHHPAGDIKKISTYTQTLTTTTWTGGASNAHWRVYWAGTTNGHGVTEGGSSGSPIFNSAGLIVGTLSGGGSYCSQVPNPQPDAYGKMSYHWTSNGTTAAKQLKPWLDPTNSGATTLTGTNAPCGSVITADFTGTPTSGNAPLTVNFTSTSVGTISSYSWNFGDGGTATTQNPSHVYSAVGTYNVSLTVTGTAGSDTETKNSYITVTQPGTSTCDTLNYPISGTPIFYSVAQGYLAGNNGYGDKAMAMYFANASGFTSVSEVFFWFGRAAGSGSGSVKVWASSGGAPGTELGSATLSCSSVASDIAASSYTHVQFGAPVTVSGPFFVGVVLPTAAGDTLALVSNHVGEANPCNAWEMEANGSWANFTTSWSGNADIDLAIFPVACTGSAQTLVSNFSGSPTSGNVPLTVYFTNSVSGGTPTSYSWNFGDGGTATTANPSHVYSTPGLYTVSLYVSNASSNDTETKTNYINVLSVGENELTVQSFFSVFPNPTTGTLTVNFGKAVETEQTVKVFNTLGELVLEQVLAVGQSQMVIDLSANAKGVYYLSIQNQDGITTTRVSLTE